MNTEEGLPDLPEGVQIKPVVGYEGHYSVTSDGRVWSMPRRVKGKHGSLRQAGGHWLRPLMNRGGYPTVRLQVKGVKDARRPIHTVVARAFLGERPEGAVIDHVDQNRRNNSASNLRYTSIAANCLNTDKRRGIYTNGPRGSWTASLKTRYGVQKLGVFECARAARKAYHRAKRIALQEEVRQAEFEMWGVS